MMNFGGGQQMRPLGQMWPQQMGQPIGQFPVNPGMGGPMQGQQQQGQLPPMGQMPPQMPPGGMGAPMQPNGQFQLNPGINGGFQMPQRGQMQRPQMQRPQMGMMPSFMGQR